MSEQTDLDKNIEIAEATILPVKDRPWCEQITLPKNVMLSIFYAAKEHSDLQKGLRVFSENIKMVTPDDCVYCGKPVNNLAGDPSMWSVNFPEESEPGVCKAHHAGCVVRRLSLTKQFAEALKEAQFMLAMTMDIPFAFAPVAEEGSPKDMVDKAVLSAEEAGLIPKISNTEE